jgi:hypothetical protein
MRVEAWFDLLYKELFQQQHVVYCAAHSLVTKLRRDIAQGYDTLRPPDSNAELYSIAEVLADEAERFFKKYEVEPNYAACPLCGSRLCANYQFEEIGGAQPMSGKGVTT